MAKLTALKYLGFAAVVVPMVWFVGFNSVCAACRSS